MGERVHIVGIGGAAMSAIATIRAAMGDAVSGSDLGPSAAVDRLRSLGIDVAVGPHDAANVPDGVDVVVRSSAIGDDNPEVEEARRRGVPVRSRAEALAAICAARRTAAVSGTHGKTTTTAMLVTAVDAGSYLVGGDLVGRGSGVAWGPDAGSWFVAEADESDRTFLALPAEVVVATNVEADHLDTYGSLDGVVAAFDRYLGQAPAGGRIVCADEPNAMALARRHGATTYGTHEDADWRILDPEPAPLAVRFRLAVGGADRGPVEVPAPGLHNARNAVAALAAAEAMGVDFADAVVRLARYEGVARRFQVRGRARGVTVVDDYAHNPGKVAALLAAARAGGWRRVVVVFQPHRYTRTADLWRAFGPAFGDADAVVVTEVYAAHEAPIPGVTGKLVVDAVLEAHPWKRVAWLPGRADVLRWLAAELRPGDLCITAGAGDVTTWADDILAALA